MPNYILALDQGTTSSRALLFDENRRVCAQAQQEFTQYFPRSGWVEHDAEEIWQSVLHTARTALAQAGISVADVAGIGITNQRETVVIWDRTSGEPIHKAIVWQDRRTADLCARLRAEDCEELVRTRSGLLLDPYFSATKVAWILDAVPGARERAERGELAFGTIDSFLIWRLTGGQVHATDATNAARTCLYNIFSGDWDDELLRLFRVPRALLPDVRDSAGDFGSSEAKLLGASLAIRGVAGDQQAATVGQACFQSGMIKSTYGTGCFALINTGSEAILSKNRLLTTVAYQLDGQVTYALEGAIFIAGAAVQWLRDGLRMIHHAAEAEVLARHADAEQEVMLVPAFTGLGAPYWDSEARGAIFGLTRNSGPAELARATLQSVGLQTRDLFEAMRGDWPGCATSVLRVDGGMSASDWTMQFLADMLNVTVERPAVRETTALGAAYLAGLGAGVYPAPAAFADQWYCEARFQPAMASEQRQRLYTRWQDCVARTLQQGPEAS